MLNVCRYIKLINNYLFINIRYLSKNKSNLVESSKNIQKIIKISEDKISILKWFYFSLNEIHEEYPEKEIATSTKNIYQINSSKLNSIFIQLEKERKNHIGDFKDNNSNDLIIILLRYIRFLEISFIYRLITFDINNTLKDISNLILNLAQNENNFNKNSLSLISELIFFLNYLSSNQSLSQVKFLLSKTYINNYLLNYLYKILNEDGSILLINELCLTLYSIVEIPSSSIIDLWPCILLKYLYNKKSNSLSIIKYLILIQHNSINSNKLKMISYLNKYLNEIGIYQNNLNIICQLLILISSLNYSHELFHKEIIKKIQNFLKQSNQQENILFENKLYCRLIYYLCLNDPTNEFNSRTTIIQLSKQINKNLNKEINYPQWIVQCQHGMMLLNIYNYQLLFSTVQQTFFPLLFRDLGIYSSTIYRQLFDIHYALSFDRPSLETPLLNSQMLSFSTQISNKYRSSIKSNQKSYNLFLYQLKQIFNDIYGNNSCIIIHTNQYYPFLLFDFLQFNLPNTDLFKSIGINTKQRIAILPILNSMLIKQQRSNGSLNRVLSAHTIMRFRIIQKNNYQLLPIFHGEFQRAIRNNTIKTTFETNLALKTIPHPSDNDE